MFHSNIYDAHCANSELQGSGTPLCFGLRLSWNTSSVVSHPYEIPLSVVSLTEAIRESYYHARSRSSFLTAYVRWHSNWPHSSTETKGKCTDPDKIIVNYSLQIFCQLKYREAGYQIYLTNVGLNYIYRVRLALHTDINSVQLVFYAQMKPIHFLTFSFSLIPLYN